MFEIGSSLREARTRQSLGFEEMEARTKVRAKYLRLLEEERFAELPGHTYVKGFLSAYANALGLDGRLYVDEYNSRFVSGEEEAPLRTRRVPAARARRRDRREHRVLVTALLLVGLVTALVIVAARFGAPEKQEIGGLDTGPASNAPARVEKVTVEIHAARGPSHVEVRAGSETGRTLYAGTLERGQVQRFPRQKAVFLAVESPGNVVVKRNGNRIALPGSEALITTRGVQAS